MNLLKSEERETIHSERKVSYIWIIKDFVCNCITQMQAKNLPSSAEFEFEFHPDLKLNGKLSLFLSGHDTNCRLILKTTSYENWEVAVNLWTSSSTPVRQHRNFSCNKHIDEILLLHNSNNCLLSRGNYTIMCELSLLRKIEAPKQNRFAIKEAKSTNDFEELFENKKYWDVKLIVKGHELHAHKCILAGRSKVFAAMFEHEMEEAKSNKVTITDIDVEVCEEMLRYIYTNKVLNLNQMASALLAASDKYDLQNLKSMCAIELGNKVSIETATKTLILSDLYRAEELKKYTLDFIKNNIKAVAKTEGWKKNAHNYPHLLAEICLQIIE